MSLLVKGAKAAIFGRSIRLESNKPHTLTRVKVAERSGQSLFVVQRMVIAKDLEC
jgi:hypothetical protein